MKDLIKSIPISSVTQAEEILKSAGTEDLFEKAKWNVGDTKVYQGVTYEVGGFNAKGTPLWRKKKEDSNSGKQDTEDSNSGKPITVKQVYNDIHSLNPSKTTVSSLGTFVSSMNQQISDDKRSEIMDYLPKDSLAYKIILSNQNEFSDKQLWVISYELMKNEDYLKNLSKRIEEIKRKIEFERIKKSAKKERKKERKKEQEVNHKNNNLLQPNDKVIAPVFGEGKVLSQSENTIDVFFDTVGKKTLIKKYAKLKKIN